MRRKILFALASIVIILTVAARIYEEVVKRRWPTPGPRLLRYWKSEAELPVDISRFFNNDGIASAADPSDANFDCPNHPPHIPGSGYPAEKLPEGGSVLKLEKAGLSFLFPVVASGEYNNVACEGQRISGVIDFKSDEIPYTYQEIAVLGAAENGAASAKLKLEYDDDTAQSVQLSFPDWCVRPGDEVTIAASAPYRYTPGQGARKSIREKIDCFMYVRRLRVNPRKRLVAIVLPDQPNLHIFAMTLRVGAPGKAVAHLGDKLARRYHRVAELAKEPPADLTQPVEELAKGLKDAEQKIEPGLARQLVWLNTQYEYLVCRLGGHLVRRGSRTESWARKSVASISTDLNALLGGRDPFRLRRGHILKGYVSEIDGRVQPYALYVPKEYRKSDPCPLVVHMHGHGWYRPFQGVEPPQVRNAIVLSPHGRGSMDYMFVAEEDVLACIDEVKTDYAIDADRVYLMGHSMGGTGSWNLATKYPDRFAAIGPSAANADSKAWKNVGAKHAKDEESFAWLRSGLRASLDPVTYAGNLLHVPAFFLHGDKDKVVPVGNSRSMAKALAEAGCPHVYREGAGGHGWRPRRTVIELHDYVLGKVRVARPQRVRVKAGYLKYGKAYWVRILRLGRRDQLGEIDAAVRSESLINVKAKGVAVMELDLNRCPVDATRALLIVVNGQPVFHTIPPPGGRIALARVGARWEVISGLEGLHKKPYLEGPVADAYTSSFVLVVGTTSTNATDRKVLRHEAERFAADWELLYTKPPRVKDDGEVTEEDIARHNLILYGGPQNNSITSRIADRLPITIKNDAVRIGGRRYAGTGVATKFCYPNPLNPERLVVVIAGAKRARDIFQSNNLFGNWFQWGPYDNRAWFDFAVFDRKTRSAETCLEFGFFGGDWQFRADTTWFGDEAEREAAPARRIPVHTWPPDQKQVYLSDLLPISIEQHKLPVGFDTSAEGKALTIGLPARRFQRGLGVRAPSKVAFRVNRANAPKSQLFTTFKATVGVDLEGETTVPSWRNKSEWVKFLVYGDGHLLYQTPTLMWRSKPVHISVPIARFKTIECEVWCSRARWLVGSAAWGNARILRADALAATK